MSEVPIHAGADEIAAHPRHTGHRWFDVVMAVSAIFISGVSLAVAIEHGHIQRELVAASNWPFLRSDITNAYGGARTVAIGVSNGGVGPAKIHSYEVMLDGRPVGSPAELLQRCCGLPTDEAELRRILPAGTVTTSMIDDTVLRPGEVNSVLVVPRAGPDPRLYDGLDRTLRARRLTYRACYCSTLDQCWTTGLKGVEPTPVAVCPRPAHRYEYDRWLPDRPTPRTH